METLPGDFLERLADQFVDPRKRVFVGYLASALVLALSVQMLVGGTALLASLARLFSRHIWWSPSSRADYRIAVLNQAIMMGVAPRLVSKLAVATLLFEAMHIWFDGRPLLWAEAPGWAVAALFTGVLFILDDSTRYLLHRWLHTWPLFWCFHKVHHTAETLTPFTVYRTHPVEGVLFALRSTFVQAAALAAFFFFLGDRVELVTVYGANALLFAFNVAGSNLRHSHVRISYGRILERVLISPGPAPDPPLRRPAPPQPELRHRARALGLARRQPLPRRTGTANPLRRPGHGRPRPQPRDRLSGAVPGRLFPPGPLAPSDTGHRFAKAIVPSETAGRLGHGTHSHRDRIIR